MTAVNFRTQKTGLMAATLVSSVLCLLNIALAKAGEASFRVSIVVFTMEIFSLFVFFIVSGIPEGVSAIWVCMLPTCGMLLYKRKVGSILSAVMLIVLIFLFETPMGQEFLRYPYTASFKLRFPMLYAAFFIVSFFLESVRALTYERLQTAEMKYRYLYIHDSLTGLYNRYGFDACMESVMRQKQGQRVSLMILDIDHFKHINDEFGHVNGDLALKQFSHFLAEHCKRDACVCRWGGEEFAIFYFGESPAVQWAKQILAALRHFPIVLRNTSVHITASIGVAETVLSHTSDPEKIVCLADAYLLNAKESGRDQVQCKNI